MIWLSNDIATIVEDGTNTDGDMTPNLQVVLPSRATSAKSATEEGQKQCTESVKRKREREGINKTTLHIHAATKEKLKTSLELLCV